MKTKIRMEGVTLAVKSVRRSMNYYCKRLGFKLEVNAAPHFAMIRVGGPQGGTIGLLSWTEARKEGARKMTAQHKRAIHVELSTDDLDGLYKKLRAKGVRFYAAPHDEPWERSMSALDPDGYTVEFAQGRRGHDARAS
jgi:catechol 2,3-dioxygenase-like lactoylglutathione lyase family enzyme